MSDQSTIKGRKISAPCGFTVVSQENWYSFGYNSDFESFMPNNFGGEVAFAAMAVSGEPVNNSLATFLLLRQLLKLSFDEGLKNSEIAAQTELCFD